MSTPSINLRAASSASTVDDAGKWLSEFLKKELTPYPGRGLVVARVTISATIVMWLVMTFKLPGGFLGAIFTLILSRENPTATLRAGIRSIASFLVAAAYLAITVAMLDDDPLTHFLWVAISLFLAFYLLRIVADYGTAVAFGFMVTGALPFWDGAGPNVETRFENTLWLVLTVSIGIVVTVIVEYVFRSIHPATDLTEGIESRLQTVSAVLRSAAADSPLDDNAIGRLDLYSTVGTSRLRRLITRSEFSSNYKAQLSAAVALLGRLLDLAASFRVALGTGAAPDANASASTPSTHQPQPISQADRERCLTLASQVDRLCDDLMAKRLPERINISAQPEPSAVRFLPEMERTAAFIPEAFAGSSAVEEFLPSPLDEEVRERIFVTDALSNTAHLRFALRGTAAALACYVIYQAIDWGGLSTALATCFITALSTIGSSRQKQVLRLGGALIGGFIFGMGSQIFILPYLDSIAGFTLLFATVTAIASWIATASARISYLGVQLALAYYLINLQEFTIQISLSIARDRVFGVLLGLLSMWLLFDRLWVRTAQDELQAVFSRNLEAFAQVAETLSDKVYSEARIRRVRILRDQINAGFLAVAAQYDALLFEFGPDRRRKLEIRESRRRWQPLIRTLLQLQMTAAQYRARWSVNPAADVIMDAENTFERDFAAVMRALADEVSGNAAIPIPDIRASAEKLRQEIFEYHKSLNTPVPTEGADVIALAESISSVLGPLYEDMHTAFAADRAVAIGASGLLHGSAHS